MKLYFLPFFKIAGAVFASSTSKYQYMYIQTYSVFKKKCTLYSTAKKNTSPNVIHLCAGTFKFPFQNIISSMKLFLKILDNTKNDTKNLPDDNYRNLTFTLSFGCPCWRQ